MTKVGLAAAGAVLFTLAMVGAAAAREPHPAVATWGEDATSDTAAQITEAMIDAGRKIFHGPGSCFACHGQNLQGTAIAPRLSDSTWKNGDGSYADIVKIVTNGVPGTAMVSHPGGISDEQLLKVAAYVWAVSHGKAKV
jgi:mono/diheme cytochrome c family protein